MGRNGKRFRVQYNQDDDKLEDIQAISEVSDDQVLEKAGEDDMIIIKGSNGNNGHSVNLTQLKKILKGLREKANVKTEDLTGEDANNFRYVVDLANVLYQSGGYLCVYKAINEIFAGVHKPLPGTVGAYFVGCHTQNMTFGGKNGCSAVCAGAFKPPAGHGDFKPCEHLVILIDTKTGEFKQLNDPEDKSKAFIHVVGSKNFSLSPAQNNKLRSLGVKKVKIYAYDMDSSQYTALTNGFIDICQGNKDNGNGKNRRNGGRGGNGGGNGGGNADEEGNAGAYWFLFFVILIIIIIFIVWLVWSGNSSGYVDWMRTNGLVSE